MFKTGKFSVIVLILSFILANPLLAQESEQGFSSCETFITPEQAAYEISVLEKGGFKTVTQREDVYYVPVSFHIVRRSDGTGGYAPERIHISMRDLNIQFQPTGIQFYRLREGDDYAVHYLDDDYFYYNTDNNDAYFALLETDPIPNTINVYFVPSLPACGMATYTSTPVQGIMINNSCSGEPRDNSTLAHEVGHYFDLYHTHETYFGIECPDSSNCDIAGDLLCDTPADPMIWGSVDANCEYLDNIPTPPGCGGTYSPQTHNLMSYSTILCRDFFTSMQIDKMIYTLVNLRPELILTDSTDSDSDGIVDILDNCPYTANSDQTDTDYDYFGDICDNCPQDYKNDIDGDGLCADVDNCPTLANPNQIDNDANGIGDECGCTDGSHQFTGQATGDILGYHVSGAGDINNDGYDDIVVTAYNSSLVDSLAGQAFIYSGIDGGLLYDLRGEAAGDNFGIEVSGAGDVNNDGFDDVIIGAHNTDANGSNSGSAHIFYGAEGGFPAVKYASEADVILSGESAGDNFGASVSNIGDVDNDNFDDILIGATQSDAGLAGKVYLYSGQTGELIYSVSGTSNGDYFGYSISGAGLVDEDTVPDFIVGAMFSDFAGDNSGMAYVYSGVDGSLIHSLWGSWNGDNFGRSVSGAGDVNNDGRNDLIVGSPYNDVGSTVNAGRANIYSGANGSLLHSFTGFESYGLMGWAVSAAGDVNGDGYADVAVGADLADYSSDMSGRIYIFSGQDGSILFEAMGENPSDRFGSDVSGTADLNGDGINDLIVGAYNFGATGAQYTGSGRVYAYMIGDSDSDSYHIGCDNCPTSYNPAQEDYDADGIGDACEMPCGDANNDSKVNILDITFLIAFLYKEGPTPVSFWVCDVNGDGMVNILDITYLISYLYKDGPEPNCP